MTAPTFVNASPTNIRTGGRQLVRIRGGNFQLAPPPSALGITPKPNPPCEVLFGTVPAFETRVLATSLLHVVTPVLDPGTYPITIRNLYQDGTPIPGESVTVAGVFTATRPTIGAVSPAQQSNLTRLVSTLVSELRRQVLENVVLTTHTDYDDTPDGANVAALASTPGIVLSGPFLTLNQTQNTNQKREAEDAATGETTQLRRGRVVDVGWTLIGVDNLATRELDLMHECITFFVRNERLRMVKDPAVPAQFVDYEMEITDEFRSIGQTNASNTRAFSGSFVVRGLSIDDADMRERAVYEVIDILPTTAMVVPIPPED